MAPDFGERNEVLLERQISVDGNENIELLRRESQQLTILGGRPPHLPCGLDVLTNDVS
jgi:hypothetical protein